jgi:hypothetical protein
MLYACISGIVGITVGGAVRVCAAPHVMLLPGLLLELQATSLVVVDRNFSSIDRLDCAHAC